MSTWTVLAFGLGGLVGAGIMWWWVSSAYRERFLEHVIPEVLAEEPLYGYALGQKIEWTYPAWGMIPPAALQRALFQLEQRKVIRKGNVAPGAGGTRRQYWEVV